MASALALAASVTIVYSVLDLLARKANLNSTTFASPVDATEFVGLSEAEGHNEFAALIGHTLCACQWRTNDQTYLKATIGACKDLGGEMETFERAVDDKNGISFRGKYCKPKNTRKLDGKGFNTKCRDHNAGDSTCPYK
ncbi:hypothetical protein EJ08DRAFT_666645 [Tothia fuscella]|uniref:Uncharacterized protein n=1 Tax=Tothia fuscella TaxID=1048955 RepID=A0A9P4TSL4_9PEZI|nr:hypothetical protein EJ08DRAFT_666645 [Tothia fuscella]